MSCWCILIYLNLEKQQANQAIINSLFIRGLHACLLHMDEPRGHTVPQKNYSWQRVIEPQRALQALELLPLLSQCSFSPTHPDLTKTRFLGGKKGNVSEASSPIHLRSHPYCPRPMSSAPLPAPSCSIQPSPSTSCCWDLYRPH